MEPQQRSAPVPALRALADRWQSAAWPRCLVCALDIPVLNQPDAERLLALLSADEQARYGRMAVREKQSEFVVSRALLRRVLGVLLDLPPAEIELSITKDGKPLLPVDSSHQLAFNLAHSEGFVVVAVGEAAALGVDVERCGAYKAEIAGRFFQAAEYAWIEQHAPEARAAAFYRLWTIKETCIKALGSGIRDLRSVELMPGATCGTWRDLHWQTLQIDQAVQAALAWHPLTNQQSLQPQIYGVSLPWLLADLA